MLDLNNLENTQIKEGTFSILVTTRNRLHELKKSLDYLFPKIDILNHTIYICDDASTDGTYEYIKTKYPKIVLIRNKRKRGYIYSRNLLLGLTSSKYAIILDDDSHIVNFESLKKIKSYFESNPNCAVIAGRIFWGLKLPDYNETISKSFRIQGYVGCGHVWRMSAWKAIPDYPEWLKFYGEEDYASLILFKKNFEIIYLSDFFVHHRVNLKARKKNKIDYVIRQMRAYSSGWMLYLLFFPLDIALRNILYSCYSFLKTKLWKGNILASIAWSFAIVDFILKSYRVINFKYSLSKNEVYMYKKLARTEIYWSPDKI